VGVVGAKGAGGCLYGSTHRWLVAFVALKPELAILFHLTGFVDGRRFRTFLPTDLAAHEADFAGSDLFPHHTTVTGLGWNAATVDTGIANSSSGACHAKLVPLVKPTPGVKLLHRQSARWEDTRLITSPAAGSV
jgi:hypothetical protein